MPTSLLSARIGSIPLLNSESTGGKNPVHLSLDPGERFLIVTNYAQGTGFALAQAQSDTTAIPSIAVLPIQPNGSIGPMTDFVELSGKTGPHRTEQPNSRPHHVRFDPSGRFLAIPDKGLDMVFVFRLDSSTGKLIASDTPFATLRESAGPRHIEFHPSLPCAYTVNEIDSSVTQFAWDAARGALSTSRTISSLPPEFHGYNRSAEIAIAPSGHFLYASNRGHDSIAIFEIDRKIGTLTSVGWQSSMGKAPRFITFSPVDDMLYATNEGSDSITAFRVDATTGKLIPAGVAAHTGSPVNILFVAEY
jgi:6-phosphogluconolactonase